MYLIVGSTITEPYRRPMVASVEQHPFVDDHEPFLQLAREIYGAPAPMPGVVHIYHLENEGDDATHLETIKIPAE